MVGETIIPARIKAGRDPLDSAFLLKYARGLERGSGWKMFVYALMGALFGYGLGEVVLLVQHFLGSFQTGFLNLAVLTGRHVEVPQASFFWEYLPMLTSAICAVIWGAKGMGKADDMKFQAQLALHVLRLHELAVQDRESKL